MKNQIRKHQDMDIGIIPSENKDLELVEAVLNGDMRAYESLYLAQKGRIYALCTRLIGNSAIAEELTQETFILAWRKLAQFRGESKLSTWLYRIATNLALDRMRLKKYSFEQAMEELDEGSAMVEMQGENSRDLEQAISQLPQGARLVFVLYELQGYSHDEISESTGIAVGTSKAQLHRAKKILKTWLSQ